MAHERKIIIIDTKVDDIDCAKPLFFTLCRAPGCRSGSDKVKLCGGCMVKAYCSTECQKADWPDHQKECESERTMGQVPSSAREAAKQGSHHKKVFDRIITRWRSNLKASRFGIYVSDESNYATRRPRWIPVNNDVRQRMPKHIRDTFNRIEAGLYASGQLRRRDGHELGDRQQAVARDE